MIERHDILELRPTAGVESFFKGKSPKLWCLGNRAILNRRLVGILSARQIDSDLALASSNIIRRLVPIENVGFVGGWHSPLEEEALRILSAETAPIVFCLPKALNRFLLPIDIESRVSQGQALLLTHCGPLAKRISRDASIRRNQLVVGLAAVLLVLSAPAGSASLKLAKSALRHGKPVLTPEHRINRELLESKASPATMDNIRAALG